MSAKKTAMANALATAPWNIAEAFAFEHRQFGGRRALGNPNFLLIPTVA